jgi:uncharacterized protein with beta-barrel porin domain
MSMGNMFNSRLKVSKGIKVSLVASALLCTSVAIGATQTVSTATTANFQIANGDSLDVTSSGSITLTNDYAVENATSGGTIGSITNSGTITSVDAIVLNDNAVLSGGITNTNTIKATNNAIDLNGATVLNGDIKNSANNLSNNDVIEDVVTTTGTLTTSTFEIEDNWLDWNFEAKNDGQNIDIIAYNTGITTLENSVSSGYKVTATALISITDSTVTDAIYSLNSVDELQTAIEKTTPQATTSSVNAGSLISSGIAGIVEQRQNVAIEVGTFGGNSGDELLMQKNVWIKPFGSFGKQDDKDGMNGFDLSTYGVGIGFDGEYKANQNFGLAFFYTNADVEVNNISQSSSLDVYTLLAYGNLPIKDKYNFLYQFGYTWQKTDTTRDVAFVNKTATANYRSKIASIDLKLLKEQKINDSLLLQPMITTTYRYYKTPSYTENGAGVLNLNIERFSSSKLLVGTR